MRSEREQPDQAQETLIRLERWPELDRPLLLVCLEGWIDAGLAARTALAQILESMPHQRLASFDADALIDFRARRPTLRIVNGVDTELTWPEIRLDLATHRSGRSVLVLYGPEPDMRWQRFCAEVVSLAKRAGVEMAVGLGAFPAPVPHTRAVRLVGTSPDGALAKEVGYLPAGIEVPAGAQAALEVALGAAGVPAVGLWARVPHYVAAMPYPAASVALLDGLGSLAGVDLDYSSLAEAAEATRTQLDQLISASAEHSALVRQLEDSYDQEALSEAVRFSDLPSGDELAAELERFLRGETGS